MSDLEGSMLGHYRIVEKIGAGGMGEVYRARDESLDRDVAIKVLPEAVAGDEARLERFRREARAVARLEHPNILAIYDFGTEGDVPYAVTELLEGQTLRERLPTSGLPWQKVVEIGAAMADGLAAAHGKDIVHRDLKPENVFVTSDDRIKILDFGLATLREEVSPEAETGTLTPAGTQPGTVVGTLGYMAPEQLKGDTADARSDIFALGCVLYEMVAGRRAFGGNTTAEMIAAILKEEPQQLSSTGASLPADLESTIHRCLEKSPAARFQSAADLAFALRSIGTGGAVAMAISTKDVQRVGVQRRRLTIAATTVVALILGATGIYIGTRQAEPAPGIGASGRPAVAVWRFEDHTGSEDTAWLATGLPSMLVTGLAQTRGLDVISTERLQEVLKNLGHDEAGLDPSLVPETARRAGAGAVVVGSIFTSGTQIRVDVQVQDVESGRLLAAHSVKGEDVFPLADELTENIRNSLQLSDSPAGRDIADVTTDSVEAYRSYWKGHVAHKELRWQQAAQLLGQAVEQDPSFAMAHFELWVLHSGYGTMPNATSEQHRRSALDNLDRLTDRQRMLVLAFNARHDGDLFRAAELLEDLIDLHPDEEWAYELLANINGWGLFRQEEHLAVYERGVAANPRSSFMHKGYAYALMYVGRYQEALNSFEALVELRPREPNSYDSLGDYYLMTGRPEIGLQKYSRALELDPSVSFPHMGRAWAFAMLGRYDEALTESQQLSHLQSHFIHSYLLSRVGRYRESGDVAREGVRVTTQAQDLALQLSFDFLEAFVALERGEYTQIFGITDRLLDRSKDLRDQASHETYERTAHILAGLAHTGLRDLEAAQRELTTAEVLLARPHWSSDDWWFAALEGEIALAMGNFDAALASIRKGEPDPKAYFVRAVLTGLVFCNNPLSRDVPARVAATRGDLDHAIAIYRDLNTPSLENKWTAVLEPRYVLQIARLLDQKGDVDGARKEYERFLELWKNADPGLPELEEARTRLARLSTQ